MQPHEPTEDEQIEAALAALDQPLQISPQATAQHDSQESVSPTLAELPENRRPRVRTVCETCPNSVWFASPAEVKCYCRVMFLVTWSTQEQNQITSCDGAYLGQE